MVLTTERNRASSKRSKRIPTLVKWALRGALAVAALYSPDSAWAQTSKPAITGVSNGAIFESGFTSGSWVSIFGTNLAPATRMWRPDEVVNGVLPLSLDGVSVKINNKPAPVYFISPTQLNVQAPEDESLGPVRVEVTTQKDGVSNSFTAELRRVSPGFFLYSPENRKYLAAVHVDGTYVAKPGLFSGVSTRPCAPGDVILLFGTGFGPTEPKVPAGRVYSGAAALTETPTVRIGGVEAKVHFAGLTAAGLYQFNVAVPELPDGDHEVRAQVGGAQSQPRVFVTVQRPPKPSLTYVSLTASPGEQLDLNLTGKNLAGVFDIKFTPPDGLSVSQVVATETSVRANLNISTAAAIGKRTFSLTAPSGSSGEDGHLNVTTFRISNPRVGDITREGGFVVLPVTFSYTDPTGAVSSGPLRLSGYYLTPGTMRIFTVTNTTPDLRTPGATSGDMRITFRIEAQQVVLLSFSLYSADNRESDTLKLEF